MRSYNSTYLGYHEQSTTEPRFTIRIDFETDFTQSVYFTSHSDSATPVSSTVVSSVLLGGTTVSQRLGDISSIGNMTLRFADVDNTVSSQFGSKLDSGYGLRLKRIRIYKGFKGLTWANYETFQTQSIGTLSYKDGVYTISGQDIQRIAKNTNLFIPKETTLLETITSTDTEFKINDGTGFPLVARGTSYSDLGSPNDDCGYIKIEDEFIRYTGVVEATITASGTDISFAAGDSSINSSASPLTDLSVFTAGQILTVSGSSSNDGDYVISSVTASKIVVTSSITTESAGATITLTAVPQFFGCSRGVLNSFAVGHEIDTTAGDDRKLKIKEHIYIERPVPKLIYAILLGTLYNQAASFPSHWTASIDTEYVANSDFTGIGDDLWDPNDDTKGVIARFEGLEKVDAKQFIEEQLIPMIGCFMPVYADGSWGLKRRAVIPEDVAPQLILDDSVVIQHDGLNYEFTKTRNQIRVEWNWSAVQEAYTRSTDVLYSTSITTHQATPVLTRKFRGFSGTNNRATKQRLSQIVDLFADRFANPPIETNVSVLPSLDVIEVGDIVQLNVSDLRDYTKSPVTEVDRAFEVQGVSTNLQTGVSSIQLMGSSAKEPPQSSFVDTVALADSFYTNQGGTNINTLTNYTNTGGVGHITGAETLTGSTTLTSGVWYHDGDLQIDAGVTVTITQNVFLLVKGELTINGAIDGKGQGRSGATSVGQDVSGYIGSAVSGGGIRVREIRGGQKLQESFRGYSISGDHNATPVLVLDYDGSNTLNRLPSDPRGTAGPVGANCSFRGWDGLSAAPSYIDIATGGNGGKSGAALALISRGLVFGASGSIDLSGGDGSNGTTYSWASQSVAAGSGGGGSPSPFYYLADGTNSSIPDLSTKLIANQGQTPIQGTKLFIPSSTLFVSSYPAYSYYTSNGNTTPSRYNASFRIQFIYQQTTAEADPNEIAPATVSNLTFATGTAHLVTQADGTIFAAANLSWTSSTDQLVDHYRIFFKKSSDTAYIKWQDEPSRSDTETTIFPLEDGVDYDFLVMSRNIYGFDQWSASTILSDQTVIGKSAAPTALTAITLISRLQSVHLVIEEDAMPTDADLSSIEIWFSASNNRNNVPSINKLTIPCRHSEQWQYTHYPETGTAHYYWFRTVDTSGNKSTFYPSSETAGIYGQPNSLFRRSGWDISKAYLEEAGLHYVISTSIAVDFSGFYIKSDGTRLYIVGTGTDKIYQFTINNAWDISSASYDGVTLDISGLSTDIDDIDFRDNGARIYLGVQGTPEIFQIDLSTAWDISTATIDSPLQSFDCSSVITEIRSFEVQGDKVFITEGGYESGSPLQNYLYEFSLSTSWDISTASIPSPLVIYDTFSSSNIVRFTPNGRRMYLGATPSTLKQLNLSIPYDLTSVENLDISSQDSLPHGITIENNGTKAYLSGASNDTVFEYDLLTPYDITSATVSSPVNSFDLSSIIFSVQSGRLKSDGTRLFVADGAKVQQFDLSTAWDISTASIPSPLVYLDTSSQVAGIVGMAFKPDGTMFFALGVNDSVYKWNLSGAWDISTASLDSPNESFNVSSEFASQTGVAFKSDGTKMFVLGAVSGGLDYVYEYTLSSAWDLTTVSLPSPIVRYAPTTPETIYGDINFNSDGTVMYLSGLATAKFYQFYLPTAWDLSTVNPWAGEYSIPNGGTDVRFREDGETYYAIDPSEFMPAIYQYHMATRSDVTTSYYDYYSFDVSGQETDCHALTFRPDGLRFYLLSDGNGYIYQYSLTEQWNLKTASYDSKSFDIFASALTTKSFAFSRGGTSLFVLVLDDDTIYQFPLSTDWDISTATTPSPQYTFTISEEATPQAMAFSRDGTKLYVIGNTNATVYQYALSSAWDFSSSITLDSPGSFDASAQITQVSDIVWRNNGKQFFLFEDSESKIYSYTVQTAWEVSTASYDGIEFSFNVHSLTNNPEGLAFSDNGEFMYIIDDTDDVIVPYSIHSLIQNI